MNAYSFFSRKTGIEDSLSNFSYRLKQAKQDMNLEIRNSGIPEGRMESLLEIEKRWSILDNSAAILPGCFGTDAGIKKHSIFTLKFLIF